MIKTKRDIILISGKQGSGKTTTSERLEESIKNKGYYVKVFKFADPIYNIHNYALNYLRDCGVDHETTKDGKLLQFLGTEWGRSIKESIWVDILKYRIDSWFHWGEGVATRSIAIIDDCRFENEFLAFDSALRVRLVADEETRKKRCDSWRENTNHPSEIGLDAFAANNQFDLYVDSVGDNVWHITTLILAQLQKDVWMEKRKLRFENGVERNI